MNIYRWYLVDSSNPRTIKSHPYNQLRVAKEAAKLQGLAVLEMKYEMVSTELIEDFKRDATNEKVERASTKPSKQTSDESTDS